MTREEGLHEIEEAKWERDGFGCLNMLVHTKEDERVYVWLSARPPYCDRGHIQLNIEGPLNLDGADSFPRFFFSFEEADVHTRIFLKWRLWKERTHSDEEIVQAFSNGRRLMRSPEDVVAEHIAQRAQRLATKIVG